MCIHILSFLIRSSIDRHLFPYLGNERGSANISEFTDFASFRYIPKSEFAGSCSRSLYILRNTHAVFHNGWMNLYSHQQFTEFPFFCTTSLTFVISYLFDNSHLNMCGDISLWFWFTFPWLSQHWGPFHVPVGYLDIFTGKCLFRSSVHFLNWII